MKRNLASRNLERPTMVDLAGLAAAGQPVLS